MIANRRTIKQLNDPLAVLRAVQSAGFSSALLAGGCIRDVANNIPVRDVDIFLQLPSCSSEFSKTQTRASIKKAITEATSLVGININWQRIASNYSGMRQSSLFPQRPPHPVERQQTSNTPFKEVWKVQAVTPNRTWNVDLIFLTCRPLMYFDHYFNDKTF